jgi:hypothetical protein
MTPEAAEKNRAYQRRGRKNNPQKHLEIQAAWRTKTPDKQKHKQDNWNKSEVGKQRKKQWQQDNLEKVRLLSKLRRQRIRSAILDAYGNRCTTCGFNLDVRALDLDHINNDGAEERKRLQTSTINEYVFKNNFPDTYQLLCRNCNWIKYLDSRDTEAE